MGGRTSSARNAVPIPSMQQATAKTEPVVEEEETRATEEIDETDPFEVYAVACGYALGTDGYAQNWETALIWFHKGAALGFAHCEGWIGYCYENGYGVGQDRQLAFQWYMRGANREQPVVDSMAQYNLGRSYASGNGTPRDPVLAEKWLRRAALNGNANAKNLLQSLFPDAEAA